jgi:membrane associated rhomboid family serine protease
VISLRSETGEETIPLDEFETRVREGLIEPSSQVRFPILTGERWVDARELDVFRRLYAPARIHFARSFTLARFPTVTVSLIAIQVILFFGVAGARWALTVDPLIAAGAKNQPNILELGETWRLLTANFLHRDVLHLFFNMFFLFNVGGAMENAYRLQDYLLILLVSALATTVFSSAMSTLPSVGASGVVLGLFGAASVFGYKYSDILPKKYRRYFGGAVLPYALFILYVGLASPDTDNWGHLGGLLGGIVAALPLDPRLLHLAGPRRSIFLRNIPAVLAVVLIVVTVTIGPVVRMFGPRLRTFESPEIGLAISYPALWSVGENHLGYPSWGNNLGTTLGLRAESRTTHPARLTEIRERFLGELKKREQDGDITAVEVLDERPVSLDGGKAIELRISLESRAGPQVTRNILIERGYYWYTISFSSPLAYAKGYEPIFDLMAQEIRLTEPMTLVKARTVVSTFPGMSSAHVELGRELAAIGSMKAAAQSYQRALQALPEQADALYGLAKLAHDYEGDLDDAEKIAESLYELRPEEAGYAALLADLRLRLGQVDGACAVLQESLDRISDPPEDLRERLRALKCGSSAFLER